MSSITLNDSMESVRLRRTEFQAFRELIYRQTGITLADNRLQLVESRLRKRLRKLGLTSYRRYFDYLQDQDSNGSEMQEMINRVTTNKTDFFREEHHFEYLQKTVFPEIIRQAEAGLRPPSLRIWSAACSTGEEPYSLAMTVQESFAHLSGWDIRILATDIDTQVLSTAESGIYHEEKAETVSRDFLQKYFLKGSGEHAGHVMIRPELAAAITFRQLNLMDSQWPVNTRFDAIFCRNVLIYFDNDTQDQLMRQFGQYLKPDGYLFIGHSESLSRLSDLYQRVGKTIYRFHDAAPAGAPEATASPMAPVTVSPSPPGASVNPGLTAGPSGQADYRSIIVGELHASHEPCQISTILGSCVATCLYDPVAKIGGMNHFALPNSMEGLRRNAAYGVNAMELLINRIMDLGGDRRRLRAKVFGGARVLADSSRNIGDMNARFVRQFLATECIPVESRYLGGDRGMQVIFETHTGRARVRHIDTTEDVPVSHVATQSCNTVLDGGVTLF